MANEVTKYDKAWADEAKKFQKKERVESSTISHRGGVFKCGDMEFPELAVIIIGDIYENAYYDGAFDPDVITSPKCYAFAEDADDLAPHESMQKSEYFEFQNADCASCEFNQWGSALKGRGKACRNMRRMLVIPAGVYTKRRGSRDLDLELYITDDADENEDHIAHAEAMTIKIPPTSVTEYKRYVQDIGNEFSRPPAGMITRIYTESMETGGHRLVFEPIEELPDELYPAIMERHEGAAESLITPYQPPEEGSAEEKSSNARSRLAGFKKKKR